MLEVSNGIGMTLCLPQHELPKNRPRTSTTVTIDLGHVIVGCSDYTTATRDLGHVTTKVQDEHVGADSVKK